MQNETHLIQARIEQEILGQFQNLLKIEIYVELRISLVNGNHFIPDNNIQL